LNYDVVYRLKNDFPELEIILNGGVADLDQVEHHLAIVDGVMMGREAYSNPYVLARVDSRFYADEHEIPARNLLLEQYIAYCELQLEEGASLYHLARHALGVPGCGDGTSAKMRIVRAQVSDYCVRRLTL
jgi:tRNA-dihydrouridine synthase A